MFKRLLPTSLFARALLIVLLPILLAQAGAAYLFYARHWDNISRYFAISVAGEIALLTDDMVRLGPTEREALADQSATMLGIGIKWRRLGAGEHPIAANARSGIGDPLFDNVARQLETRLDYPFAMERLADESRIRIVVALPREEISYFLSKKRLSSPTIEVWFTGTALMVLLVLLVAVAFLRNQVRPIVSLARAADRFGRGIDTPGFHPHGAREVRMAAKAFLTMKERLARMLASRTEMLAAISHDLRTPLTRMKLQLELLGESPQTARLKADLAAMESMIGDYLDFVRGDGEEQPTRTPLRAFLTSLIRTYDGQPVTLASGTEDATPNIRPRAIGRALSNLIDNGLRHGTKVRVTLETSPSLISLIVEDDGPGIPESRREEAFLPFRRLDEARSETGAGLGLSIVRDIAHRHGGRVHLAQSDDLGGLRATLVLVNG